MMRGFAQDVRYALRIFGRNPGFTSVAVLTLAPGIGATTAIFSVVNRVLLRPFPYHDPDRLVLVRTAAPGGGLQPFLSGAEVADLQQAGGVFARVGVIVPVGGNLTGEGEMEQVPAASVSDGLLPTLGVAPLLGCGLHRTDVTRDRVRRILISHELWQRRYGGDPRILERRIEVNNMPVSVAGVLPPGFRVYLGRDANVPAQIDIWFPAAIESDTDRRFRPYTVIGRLADGVTVEQARTRLAAVAAAVNAADRVAYGASPLRFHLDRLQDDTAREARPALVALMGAVSFVLLIACANVAHLLLARIATRRGELAVRTALGARRGRVVRQLLTEGLVLGAAGAGLGVLVAAWGEGLLVSMRPATLPPIDDRGLDPRVLAVAVLIGLGVSLLFAAVPAVHGARGDPNDALKGAGRSVASRQRRLRTALVAGEVGLAIVLLAGAGLMIRSVAALRAVDLGFSASAVLTMEAPMQPRAFREIP
jgi:predicted permease